MKLYFIDKSNDECCEMKEIEDLPDIKDHSSPNAYACSLAAVWEESVLNRAIQDVLKDILRNNTYRWYDIIENEKVFTVLGNCYIYFTPIIVVSDS